MAFSLQAAIDRHILPKANEIVDTAQEDFKSVYPFQLKKMRHVSSIGQKKVSEIFQYNKQTYQNTFKPLRKTVREHFTPKNLIYDKFNNNFDEEMFNTNIYSVQKLKNLRNNDFIINREQTQEFSVKGQDVDLVFDSRFECGNLSLVAKIQDQFFMLLHNDVNTSGYTNWFYFSVEPRKVGKYKMAILNFGKAGWAYGMGIGICSKVNNQWTRAGQNIFCQSNTKIFGPNDPFRNFNTFSFQFQFTSLDKVYFSYNLPYSYTDLLTTLDEIQRQKYPYYHRKLAGTTICGNRIEMLTVGNFQKHKLASSSQDVPVIVLLARSHAGETVSSWLLHFFLLFLLSDKLQARILRDKFLFKIFPMINPDGVIHGNYRCSLIGRDLNRRWNKAIKELYPEVYYVKNQILQLSQKKPIKLVVDLHGHSQKKQAFFFGCNDKNQPHKCRLLPYLLSKLSQNYDFGSSNFCLDKSKLSTARITLFMLLKNCDVFTLETSQFGLKSQVFYQFLFQQIGQALAKGIYFYFKLNKLALMYQKIDQNNQKTQIKRTNSRFDKFSQKEDLKQDVEKTLDQDEQVESNNLDADQLQKQIMENAALLKSGNEKDDGSDSDPSECNINFDNLTKMSNRKQMRINSLAEQKIKKKSVNRSIVANKRLQMNKKSIDLLPESKCNTKMLPIPKRFASTSHSYRKNSQDSTSQFNVLLKTTSKFPNPSNSQRGISPISKSNKTQHQQLVKMINFQLSFEGFSSQRSSSKKRKFKSTNNEILNKILDVRLNNFVNYTQPALARPYSFLYRNKKS